MKARTPQLDRVAAAAVAGIKPKSLDTARKRGVGPTPDGYIGRSPWWYGATIEVWMAQRRTRPGNWTLKGKGKTRRAGTVTGKKGEN